MEESPDIGLLGHGWLSPNGLRGLAGCGKLWAVGLTAVDGQRRIGCISVFFCLFGLHAIKTESEPENRIDTICGPNPKTETRKTDQFGLFGFGSGSGSVNGFKMPSPRCGPLS
jgi:hypothetical protein